MIATVTREDDKDQEGEENAAKASPLNGEPRAKRRLVDSEEPNEKAETSSEDDTSSSSFAPHQKAPHRPGKKEKRQEELSTSSSSSEGRKKKKAKKSPPSSSSSNDDFVLEPGNPFYDVKHDVNLHRKVVLKMALQRQVYDEPRKQDSGKRMTRSCFVASSSGGGNSISPDLPRIPFSL